MNVRNFIYVQQQKPLNNTFTPLARLQVKLFWIFKRFITRMLLNIRKANEE